MSLLIRLAYRLMRWYWFLFRPVTLGVRLIPVKDNKILLVRHSYQPAWFLPGGGVKRGETLEQAVRREAKEECGATLHQVDLFGIYSDFSGYKSDHIAVFICKDFTVTGKVDHEIERVAFFDLNCLPEDLSPGSLRRIQDYQSGYPQKWGIW